MGNKNKYPYSNRSTGGPRWETSRCPCPWLLREVRTYPRAGQKQVTLGWCRLVGFEPGFCRGSMGNPLGVDSFAILFNHRSFQTPAVFPGVSSGFLERRIPGFRIEMEGIPRNPCQLGGSLQKWPEADDSWRSKSL